MFKVLFLFVLLFFAGLFGSVISGVPHVIFDSELPPVTYVITGDEVDKIEPDDWMNLPDPGFTEKQWDIAGWIFMGVSITSVLFIYGWLFLVYNHTKIYIDKDLVVERGSVGYIAKHTAVNNIHIASMRCLIQKHRMKKGVYPQRVSVKCWAKIKVGSMASEVNDFIQANVRDALENTVGLEVNKIEVNVRYAKEKKG